MSANFRPGRVVPFVPNPEFIFGINHSIPGRPADELWVAKPECVDQTVDALNRLQGGKPFIVRTTLRFDGSQPGTMLNNLPAADDLAKYASGNRKLDLVLSNWDRTGNLLRWRAFIENAISRYGALIRSLQICEEPNRFEYPGDGRFGYSVDAVLEGLKTAVGMLRKSGLQAAVGFNSVPAEVAYDAFWERIAPKMHPELINCLDYVGLNLYLDVSEPLVGEIEDAVEHNLHHFRNVTLAGAGIPASVPIHITESGWPTGPNRFYSRQAELLERTLRKIYALRSQLNISQFELFALKDSDTANPRLTHQFGIVRDDYKPKPAFQTYQQLIREL